MILIPNKKVEIIEIDNGFKVINKTLESTPGIKIKYTVEPYTLYQLEIKAYKQTSTPVILFILNNNNKCLLKTSKNINNQLTDHNIPLNYTYYNHNYNEIQIALLFISPCKINDSFIIETCNLEKINKEVIHASLASIPSRKKSLKITVNSIINQVDFLHIYLNNYKKVPNFLKNHKKIDFVCSQKEGDRGDAGKFWWSDKIKGYHFTCDDDILYSKKYFTQLLEKLEFYQHKVVVGMHGVILKDKFTNYFKSRKVFQCRRGLKKDIEVTILGTGALCYHTDTIQVKPYDFKKPNMADIWFGLIGQKQHIPFICVERKNPLINLNEIDLTDTIHYNTSRKKKSKMNAYDILNNVIRKNWPWTIQRII